MTVLELMQYLQRLCFEGKGQYMVRAAEEPFESTPFTVEPFSTSNLGDGTGTIMLGSRERCGLDPRVDGHA